MHNLCRKCSISGMKNGAESTEASVETENMQYENELENCKKFLEELLEWLRVSPFILQTHACHRILEEESRWRRHTTGACINSEMSM